MTSYAIVQAPSDLGLRPTGVRELPRMLLSHGIAERLGARTAAVLEVPPYEATRHPQHGTLNTAGIGAFTPRLADAVERVLDRHEFPIVLGGDCSIVLGSMLALRRRGRYGLLFVDGHADFYQPEVNPNGEAASMDLAFATGRGPTALTTFEGLHPLVRDEDVVAFGFRDHAEQAQYGSQPLPESLTAIDLPRVRALGIEAAAARALAALTRPELDGFFVHVDADCLNDDVMPAVDYRLADGLTPAELTTLLRTAIASGRAVGIEITIYNPNLDHDGAAGRRLAEILVAALS
jgi:arginase